MTDTQPITIMRGAYKGTVEAAPGLRVALMVAGDRSGFKCFEYRVEGTVEQVNRNMIGMPEVTIRFDEAQPYVGERLRVYAHEVTALD